MLLKRFDLTAAGPEIVCQMISQSLFRNLVLVASLTITSALAAGTYKVPEEDPIITLRVSDKWKTHEHEEYVETVSPDGNAHALVLPVEGSKVAESMGEAMQHIRRHGGFVVKAATVKEGTVKVKDREIPTVSWDATEHGRPVKIRCYVFTGSDARRVILMTWGVGQHEQKNHAELSRILKSIEPSKPPAR